MFLVSLFLYLLSFPDFFFFLILIFLIFYPPRLVAFSHRVLMCLPWATFFTPHLFPLHSDVGVLTYMVSYFRMYVT